MLMTMMAPQRSEALGSDHDFHQDSMQDDHQSSSYHHGSIGLCRVFDCMDGWSSIFSWNGADDITTTPKNRQSPMSGKEISKHGQEPDGRKKQRKSILFRNPLADKMVKDAVERSKYNTKSRQMMLQSEQDEEMKEQYDKNDELIDQRVALAVMKKRQKRQLLQQQQQRQQSLISYSRKQHRIHQQQQLQLQHQQKKNAQDAPHSFMNLYSKKKPERSQTPTPVPGPSKLEPKKSLKKGNQIVPKRRHVSTTSAISLLSRKDSNDSKRQSPPTSYCPPVSTPLVPIGEGKAMKMKKQKLSMKWHNRNQVTPFQPDKY